MIFDFVQFYPLGETIETFYHIYSNLIDGNYSNNSKEQLKTLVKLSEIFRNTIGKVLISKELLKQKTLELNTTNPCDLTKLVLETEINSLNLEIDHLTGKDTNFPFDDLQNTTTQEILQFYFDSKEDDKNF